MSRRGGFRERDAASLSLPRVGELSIMVGLDITYDAAEGSMTTDWPGAAGLCGLRSLGRKGKGLEGVYGHWRDVRRRCKYKCLKNDAQKEGFGFSASGEGGGRAAG